MGFRDSTLSELGDILLKLSSCRCLTSLERDQELAIFRCARRIRLSAPGRLMSGQRVGKHALTMPTPASMAAQ